MYIVPTKKAATSIGDRVSIGHGAIVHGCDIKNDVLIGMRATVMDHAFIEPFTIIGAGAVVPENSHLEGGYVYAGVPAKKLKPIDKEQIARLIARTADNYVMYSGWYK